MKSLVILIFLPFTVFSQVFTQQEVNRYRAEAAQVTIIRDQWGIAHVYGNTDADAVFGLLYAQCEENFTKVEENNLEMMGRLSEIGEADPYDDLQMRLIYDSSAAIRDYRNAPAWFRKLLDAAADGVNFWLYKHPETHPALLHHFEPWFALMRTNGSISATQNGGITKEDMKRLYKLDEQGASARNSLFRLDSVDEYGSNGFAIASAKTQSKHAILYINPHVTFYYRTEMQMVSNEGLNAYGGVTWGTFFIFQGFNQHCGWMHTSSDADVADLYQEEVRQQGDSLYYLYDNRLIPVATRQIQIRYKQGSGLKEQTFLTYSTGHGPVMGSRDGKWLSLKENNRSLAALMQSWLRTKANGFTDFKKVMDMRSNSSDNTVFADDKGNIAYWHGDFMPARDGNYDWSRPVDGTTSKTAWKGIYELDSLVHVYNPSTGWIQNCNSTPFTVSGSASPIKSLYPVYMAPDPENYRAINAQRLLDKISNATIEKVIKEVGYSHYLSAFEDLLPPLFSAYDSLSSSDSLKLILSEPIEYLLSWNKSSSDTSIATTIAIEWASRVMRQRDDKNRLVALEYVIKDLEKRFGTWRCPWGSVNRYQRVEQGADFSDSKPSLPVGLASATWGSLPSFQSQRFPATNKRYGYTGNSFVACVEFGPKVKAKTVITGGQSFDPASGHFIDQAQMYINGEFKDVLFYKDDVLQHAVKTYHPGE